MVQAQSSGHEQKQHLAAVSAAVSSAGLIPSKFCIIDVDIDGGVKLFFDLEINLLHQTNSIRHVGIANRYILIVKLHELATERCSGPVVFCLFNHVHRLDLLHSSPEIGRTSSVNVEEIEDFWIVELVSSSPAVGTGCVIWGSGAEVAAR
jgi:hypothetical protein